MSAQRKISKLPVYIKNGSSSNFYLNNRVLLSKALSCDRLPEEI